MSEKGTKLRQWRIAQGYTIREVADLTGMDESVLSNIEAGKRTLKPAVKVRFSRAVGARIRDLFDPEPADLEQDEQK